MVGFAMVALVYKNIHIHKYKYKTITTTTTTSSSSNKVYMNIITQLVKNVGMGGLQNYLVKEAYNINNNSNQY